MSWYGWGTGGAGTHPSDRRQIGGNNASRLLVVASKTLAAASLPGFVRAPRIRFLSQLNRAESPKLAVIEITSDLSRRRRPDTHREGCSLGIF